MAAFAPPLNQQKQPGMKTKTSFLKILSVAAAIAMSTGAFAHDGNQKTIVSDLFSNVTKLPNPPSKWMPNENDVMLLHIIRPPNPHKRVLNFIEKTRYS